MDLTARKYYFCFAALILLLACCNKPVKDDAFCDKVAATAQQIYDSGDHNRARAYLDSVYDAYPGLPPYYLYLRYHCRARWCYFQGKFDSNDIYIDSMLGVLEHYHLTKKYATEYANGLSSKGDISFVKNNFSEAFEFFSKSKIAAQYAKDTCAIANLSYHLGMVSYKQEKYGEAVSYFKESLQHTGSCPDDQYQYYRKEELLDNIGLAYTHMKQYDSALAHYDRALKMNVAESKRLNQTEVSLFAEKANGVIYGNIARLYIARNMPDSAEQLLLKSIAINTRPRYENRDALYSRIRLAELYYDVKKLPQAATMLGEVAKTLDTVNDQSIRLRWLHLTYLCNKSAGATASAMSNLESYLALKDSVDEASAKLKQTDYGQLLKTKEVQYQVALLKKNSQLDRLYMFLAIGLSLLTLGIIALIYRNYRISRKNVRTLTTLNGEIQDQKAQLETTMVQLQASNNDKDRILHVVAHDLRNPVSAVISLASIIEMDGDVNEEQKESLDMINSASNSALLLIGEILEFSGDANKMTAGEKEITDINELARMAAAILKFKATEKKQEINLVLYPEPLTVMAYPGKTGRVFSNLISNAIKFSPEHASIDVSVSRKDKFVHIEVTDHGIGISEKYKSSVFQMFTDAKRKGTAGEPSFGLGLSICKQIVEADNGRIWVESTEGIGSTFFIELPLYETKDAISDIIL